jgi:hypothetical protein
MRKIALFAAALTALVLITVGTWTGVRTYPISALAGSTVHASGMTGAKVGLLRTMTTTRSCSIEIGNDRAMTWNTRPAPHPALRARSKA